MGGGWWVQSEGQKPESGLDEVFNFGVSRPGRGRSVQKKDLPPSPLPNVRPPTGTRV